MAALPKVHIGSALACAVSGPMCGVMHNFFDRGIEKASRIANKWTTVIAITSLGESILRKVKVGGLILSMQLGVRTRSKTSAPQKKDTMS